MREAKDYSTDPGCYGLKPLIDNLLWIHEHLANGTTAWWFADDQAIIYERQGLPGLLVGLNSNSQNVRRPLTVQTDFGANVHSHDYTGHADD
jgi:alpha-amylase